MSSITAQTVAPYLTWAADNTGNLALATGGISPSTALYINNAQQVGIGTTTPSYTLHVNGSAYTSGYTSIGTTAAVRPLNVYGEASVIANTNNGAYINVHDANGNNGSSYSFWIRGLTSSGATLANLSSVVIASNLLQTYGTIQSTTGGFTFPDSTTQTSAAYNGSYSLVTGSRAFGTVYQNTSGKNMIVGICIAKTSAGNTMYFQINSSGSGFPAATAGGNSLTVAASVMYGDTGCTYFSAMVPKGYYYNLVTDGGSSYSIGYWTEYLVG